MADEIVNIVEVMHNPDLKTVLEPDCMGRLAQADLECEGEIGAAEWDGAVEGALEKKLAQRAAEETGGQGPEPLGREGKGLRRRRDGSGVGGVDGRERCVEGRHPLAHSSECAGSCRSIL